MKIHSKFNDYYDSVLGLGVDEDTSWVRNTHEVSLQSIPDQLIKWKGIIGHNLPKLHDLKEAPKKADQLKIDSYIVIFAGKIYPGIVLSFLPIASSFKERVTPLAQHWCNSIDQLDQIINRYGYNSFNKNDRVLKGVQWNSKNSIKRFFNQGKNIPQHLIDQMHYDLGSPIILFTQQFIKETRYRSYNKFKCNINPCLRDIGFMSVIDPYTAFQELSMYVSGVLGTNSTEIIHISDESKKRKRGFDEKSFKNRGTKKPRKKNNVLAKNKK